jgi:hypothetical protein
MDILYYSNYCKHSKEILQYLVKNDVVKSLNCLCVDKRKVDPTTGQIFIVLENGTSVVMPPNIHSVPSLMLVRENYRVIMGNSIKGYFQPTVMNSQEIATQGNGEPMSFALGTKDVISEMYTMYNATPEDLSAKGSSKMRNMHHYVSAEGNVPIIPTPPDTYKPNKLSQDVTIETLQQQRNNDMNQTSNQYNQTPFLPPPLKQ